MTTDGRIKLLLSVLVGELAVNPDPRRTDLIIDRTAERIQAVIDDIKEGESQKYSRELEKFIVILDRIEARLDKTNQLIKNIT